jgi:hypothetical protein
MKYRIQGGSVDVVAPLQVIADLISELSGRGTLADGRPFANYILRQIGTRAYGRTRDRVYVACAKGSPGRALIGRGFTVERAR